MKPRPAVAAPPVRPFLKWAGGKAQLLPHLQPFVPAKYARYIEPFLGGGAVYFHLSPHNALLGDSNAELINAFQTVRDEAGVLMGVLDSYRNAAGGDEEGRRDYYYKLRDLEPEKLTGPERAARFIYLNKTGYNGLYRVNKKGRFNVPFGRHPRHPQLYDRDNIEAASALLKGADLRLADFEETMADGAREDFLYLDPPYDPLTATANFTGYTTASFHWAEQQRLAGAIRKAGDRGCLVLLNNSDTGPIRDLYKDFRIIRIPGLRRAINSDPTRRLGATELVITNY